MNTFKHQFTCMISGPSGCGKTRQSLQTLNRVKFRDIVFERTRLYIKSSWPGRENESSIIEASPITKRRMTARNWLLDDLLNKASTDVWDVFTKESHRRTSASYSSLIMIDAVEKNCLMSTTWSYSRTFVTRNKLRKLPDKCIPKAANLATNVSMRRPHG